MVHSKEGQDNVISYKDRVTYILTAHGHINNVENWILVNALALPVNDVSGRCSYQDTGCLIIWLSHQPVLSCCGLVLVFCVYACYLINAYLVSK